MENTYFPALGNGNNFHTPNGHWIKHDLVKGLLTHEAFSALQKVDSRLIVWNLAYTRSEMDFDNTIYDAYWYLEGRSCGYFASGEKNNTKLTRSVFHEVKSGAINPSQMAKQLGNIFIFPENDGDSVSKNRDRLERKLKIDMRAFNSVSYWIWAEKKYFDDIKNVIHYCGLTARLRNGDIQIRDIQTLYQLLPKTIII